MLQPRRPLTYILLFPMLFLLIGIHESLGQINTDRPTQSAGSAVVPAGRFQVETGAQFTDINETSHQFTYHATLLRYGLNDFFELRLSNTYEMLDPGLDGSNVNYTGFSPIALGFKSKIASEKGFWPEISFLGQFLLPSGQDEFKVNTAVPSFRFNFGHSISDNQSIGYNWGMEWSDGSSEATNIYTFVYSLSFADGFTAFAEVYGFIADGLNDHRFDTGLIYLFNDTFQVDVSGGLGMTEDSPDGFLGLGLSFYVD